MPHLPETFFKGLFAQNNKQFEKYVVTCAVEVKIEDDALKKKKACQTLYHKCMELQNTLKKQNSGSRCCPDIIAVAMLKNPTAHFLFLTTNFSSNMPQMQSG